MSNIIDFLTPVRFKSQALTATASQTVFTLTTITMPNSDQERTFLTVNGIKQPYSAYTVDSTTQFTLSEGAEVGDVVEMTVPSFK